MKNLIRLVAESSRSIGATPNRWPAELRGRAHEVLADGTPEKLRAFVRELAGRRPCGGGPCGWQGICRPTDGGDCIAVRAQAMLDELSG